jgi:hypothetical protein
VADRRRRIGGYVSSSVESSPGDLPVSTLSGFVMENDDELRQQLEEMLQALSPAERELWGSLQKFIETQTAAGVPRERAYQIARNLLRAAANYRAGQRRAAFKLIKPD